MADVSELPSQAVIVTALSSKKHAFLCILMEDYVFSVGFLAAFRGVLLSVGVIGSITELIIWFSRRSS